MVTFTPPAGSQPGQTYLLDVQVPQDVSASGLYAWTLSVQVSFSGTTPQQYATTSGQAQVVVNDASPYGPGWGIDSVNRLVLVTGGALLVTGAGDSLYFASNGDGTFDSPAEDFGTLSGGECQGSYVYTAPDQTQSYFDLNGRLTAVVDPHSLTTGYAYDGSLLTEVTTPDGGTSTLAYGSRKGVRNLFRVDEPFLELYLPDT